MPTCEEEVALAMPGDKLTPEELIQVKLWCGDSPAYMVVQKLQFNRAVTELRLLFKFEGCANDKELWELAFALLSVLMDPKAALVQAKAELDQSRAAQAELDKQKVLEQVMKARKVANQGLNADGGGLGGGPK